MLSPVSEEQFSLVSPESSNHLPLICDETVKYTGRMEEGCDITTDSLYNYWLLSQPITSLPDKSSARIVTSEECRKQINEKHLKKAEEQKQKEARKIEREKKRIEKQEKMKENKKPKMEKISNKGDCQKHEGIMHALY